MLKIQLEHNVLTLTLNRPDMSNAFNAELIQALTSEINKAHESDSIRVVVIRGAGKHFSAGADLNWMLSMKQQPIEVNVADAQALAQLMVTLNHCRKPVVAVVQGAVMGGGVGLVACADVVISTDTAFYSLSETRLGLTPATISPFVVNAIGARQARRYMLTGERFDAERAMQIGLVHDVVSIAQLETFVESIVHSLSLGGPLSHRKIKKLIHDVSERPLDETLMNNLSWRIANQRVSDEGQEGIQAFLEKRSPKWVEDEDL
jgi:methylglutaconyl-CoA hydratase